MLPLHQRELGGSGEIRTHGTFLFVCFQDRCNKPDSATLPKLQTKNPSCLDLGSLCKTYVTKIYKRTPKHHVDGVL